MNEFDLLNLTPTQWERLKKGFRFLHEWAAQIREQQRETPTDAEGVRGDTSDAACICDYDSRGPALSQAVVQSNFRPAPQAQGGNTDG